MDRTVHTLIDWLYSKGLIKDPKLASSYLLIEPFKTNSHREFCLYNGFLLFFTVMLVSLGFLLHRAFETSFLVNFIGMLFSFGYVMFYMLYPTIRSWYPPHIILAFYILLFFLIGLNPSFTTELNYNLLNWHPLDWIFASTFLFVLGSLLKKNAWYAMALMAMTIFAGSLAMLDSRYLILLCLLLAGCSRLETNLATLAVACLIFLIPINILQLSIATLYKFGLYFEIILSAILTFTLLCLANRKKLS